MNENTGNSTSLWFKRQARRYEYQIQKNVRLPKVIGGIAKQVHQIG